MSDLVVFDTNVFVSYFLPSKRISAVKLSVVQITKGSAVPVFSDAIISEYNRVLRYKKFDFPESDIAAFVRFIVRNGFHVVPFESDAQFTDKSDKHFYDAALTAGAKYLVTGNKRHFPREPFIVSDAEYLDAISNG